MPVVPKKARERAFTGLVNMSYFFLAFLRYFLIRFMNFV